MQLNLNGEITMSGRELAERIERIEEMNSEELEDIEEVALGGIDIGDVFKPDSPTGCCSASSCSCSSGD